ADMIAPDPEDPDIVYGGRVDKLDLRTGQTQSIDPTLATPDLYRRTWTLPLVFSKRDPKRLYFGNQKMFRTTDGGKHWETISPDLTREAPEIPPNVDAVTAANNERQGPRHGVIYAIAPSPLDAQLIWAGTDDGLIWRTRDEGAHWDNVTPAALGAWSKVGNIDASHFDADTAYVAIDRHRLDDRKPYIYRTHDGGTSWQPIVAGIRDGDFVNTVREDPQRRGLLYAATELGMYVSFDDGDRWQTLQANLPRTSVRDIDVHGNDLVIATHGRGFWIMDNISALRQIDAHAARIETRLYAPAPAIRTRIAVFTGTPLPKDEPQASNPASGGAIDYVLAQPAKKPVELAILDASGQLVRRYSSADPAPNLDPAKTTSAPEWIPRRTRLATTAGMHRFMWPLRYAEPAALADDDNDIDGVWAPPGTYTVELLVDGKRLRAPLVVTADPRIHLSDAEYAQQFAFARGVEKAQVLVALAQGEAKRLHKVLARERISAAIDAELAAQIEAADAEAVRLAGLVDAGNPSNAWAYPPTAMRSLRFVAETLGKLATAANSADAAPTPDAHAGYAIAMPAVEQSLAAWDEFKSTKFAALNARMKASGKKAISLEEEVPKKVQR
ncbi:MAG: WD40/YVTN/BNR-like repeat-containing protein, partial [Rhodanobacteraceae bacterium]